MKIELCRHGRLFYFVSFALALGLASLTSHAQAPALTTVNDTVYRADGTPAAGKLVLTWPAFTTADSKPVAAGEMTVTIGAAGALNVALAPNEGAVPAGSYYKVVYKLSDGTTSTEYWTVPAASPATLGAIRAQVVPSQMAAQLVTRQYVDSVLAGSGAGTDAVHKSGAETITGAKTFTAGPNVPAPTASGQAANKAYVDSLATTLGGNSSTKVANIRRCHLYTGVDAGAQIAACIADLPTSGGMADACGIEGAQTISATITVNKPVRLRLCGAQFSSTADPVFNVSAPLSMDGASRDVSSVKAAPGGVIFAGAGVVKSFALRHLTLYGNGDGSKALVTPAFGGGNDWSAGRVILEDVVVRDFGDVAVNFGQSTFYIDVHDVLFENNVGAMNVEYASDITIKNTNFTYPQVNAANPTGLPQLKMKGGSTFTVSECDFERNDSLHPTGQFQQPDIWLEASSPAGAPGFGWIHNNKFGPEGDSTSRVKIKVASSTGVAGDVVYNVVLSDNSFYGLGPAGMTALHFANPILNWRIHNNYFSAFSTLINDSAALYSATLGHSVFDESNVVYPIGGSAATAPTALFANGGRYFSKVAEVGLTADPSLPVNETPLAREARELRNRVTNSEDLSTWGKNGAVTITAGQTDPFGTTRASLVTKPGVSPVEHISNILDSTNLRNRMVVKFWAKAGTLNSVKMGLDLSGSGFQGAFPLFSLGADWKQYKFVYNGIPTAGTYILRFYPGNSNVAENGSIYLFGVQVSDFDSDYVKTTGTAYADASFGSRYEKKAQFANQVNGTSLTLSAGLTPASAAGIDAGTAALPFKDVYLAGSSTTPATNHFKLTGSSTGGPRTVTLPDANSVAVVPDAGAANQFVTGITAAGAITKAQPAFANLSGTVTDAQVPNNITVDLAGQATSLAANGTNCPAGQAAAGVDASGNAEGCAAVGGGGGSFVDYQKTAAAVVLDGTDKTIYTTSLAGGALGAGKCLRVNVGWRHTAGSASPTYKVWFGATSLTLGNGAFAGTSQAGATALVCNDPGSTTAQQLSQSPGSQNGTGVIIIANPATAAENTTGSVEVKFTVNAAATEQITPQYWLVEKVN